MRQQSVSVRPAFSRHFSPFPASKKKERGTWSTMFCHKRGREFGNNEIFCRWCGTLKRREQESVLSSSGNDRLAIEESEHYFKRGFCYETIVHFLAEYHGISMNVRTLKTGLRHCMTWATDCSLQEGKLSRGLFFLVLHYSSISFNDNAIVRNFYPKRFHSSKLFKDFLQTWIEFAYDQLWL